MASFVPAAVPGNSLYQSESYTGTLERYLKNAKFSYVYCPNRDFDLVIVRPDCLGSNLVYSAYWLYHLEQMT